MLSSYALSAVYPSLASDFDVTVESEREVGSVTPDAPLVTVGDVVPSLSPRQREVFLTAHEEGYYELPRGTTTAAIADRVGSSAEPAEDHRGAPKRNWLTRW